jgi:hypothetical protein
VSRFDRIPVVAQLGGVLTFRRVRGTRPTGASGAHLTTAIDISAESVTEEP